MHCIHADSTGREAYLAIAFKPSLPGTMSRHDARQMLDLAARYAASVRSGHPTHPADTVLLADAVAVLAAWHHHGIDTADVDPLIVAAVAESVRASSRAVRTTT